MTMPTMTLWLLALLTLTLPHLGFALPSSNLTSALQSHNITDLDSGSKTNLTWTNIGGEDDGSSTSTPSSTTSDSGPKLDFRKLRCQEPSSSQTLLRPSGCLSLIARFVQTYSLPEYTLTWDKKANAKSKILLPLNFSTASCALAVQTNFHTDALLLTWTIGSALMTLIETCVESQNYNGGSITYRLKSLEAEANFNDVMLTLQGPKDLGDDEDGKDAGSETEQGSGNSEQGGWEELEGQSAAR